MFVLAHQHFSALCRECVCTCPPAALPGAVLRMCLYLLTGTSRRCIANVFVLAHRHFPALCCECTCPPVALPGKCAHLQNAYNPCCIKRHAATCFPTLAHMVNPTPKAFPYGSKSRCNLFFLLLSHRDPWFVYQRMKMEESPLCTRTPAHFPAGRYIKLIESSRDRASR